MSSADDESVRRLCVLAHASALLGLILPLGRLLGPYLVLLLSPRDSAVARGQALEAIDFQLDRVVILLGFIAFCLVTTVGWWWFALFVPNLYAFGMALFAAGRGGRGETHRDPFTVRIVSSRSGSRGVPEDAGRGAIATGRRRPLPFDRESVRRPIRSAPEQLGGAVASR